MWNKDHKYFFRNNLSILNKRLPSHDVVEASQDDLGRRVILLINHRSDPPSALDWISLMHLADRLALALEGFPRTLEWQASNAERISKFRRKS